MLAIYLSRFCCYLDFDVFILAVFQFLHIRFNLSFLSLTTGQPLQRHFLTLIKEIHHRAIQPEILNVICTGWRKKKYNCLITCNSETISSRTINRVSLHPAISNLNFGIFDRHIRPRLTEI